MRLSTRMQTRLATRLQKQVASGLVTDLGDLLILRGPTGLVDQSAASHPTGSYAGGMGTTSNTELGGATAFLFDGADDYMVFDPINFGASDFSMMAWVKHDNPQNAGNDVLLSERDSGAPDKGVLWWIEDDSGDNTQQLLIDAGAIAATGNSTSDVTASTWTHVAVTLDRDGNATFYLDGVANGTLSISATSATIDDPQSFLRIGADQGGGNLFDGLMDDIQIGSRVWTQSEIAAIATNGRAY